MRSFVRVPFYLAALSWLAVGGATGVAQGPVSRVAGPINEGQVVTLMGNVHPLARGDFDQGVVAGETALGRMVLELEPSAAQQAELDALVEAQDDPGSGLFHQWLTPQEYGARFGVSGQDMARITAWLKGHGFTVEEVAASNRLILFSGTAGQVADTFHTEIHRYQVDGVEHIANAEDPQIPAALSGVVGGVVSLHDFRRRTAIGARKALLGGNETEAAARIKATAGIRASVGARPGYTAGGTHYLFPADWATIYDLNPLYSAGTMGLGTSIAIVGRSNIDVSDVTAFRATSGLTANAPAAILAGADPGLGKWGSGRIDAGRGVERGDRSGGGGEVCGGGFDGDDGWGGLVGRVHCEPRDGAGGEHKLYQLRAGDGNDGTGFLQRAVGAGGERGDERVCVLGGRGGGGLLQRFGQFGIGNGGERAVQFAVFDLRGGGRSSTRGRMRRSTGRRRIRRATNRRWGTFRRRFGTRAGQMGGRDCGHRAAGRAWCMRSRAGKKE